MSLRKAELPFLGAGLSFRADVGDKIAALLDSFDFMEVIVEKSIAGLLDTVSFRHVAQHLPLILHGVDASLGAQEPLDEEHGHAIRHVLDELHAPWFSEHLAFTRIGDLNIGQLMPIELSMPNARFIAAKVRRLTHLLERPVLMENIAYYFKLPSSTLTEMQFLLEVAQLSGCGLLLDINNLYANACNHREDASAFIDGLPEELVVEFHMAGGERRGDVYIDTHGHAIGKDVFDLYDYAVQRLKPLAVVLERESNLHSVEELVSEVAVLRASLLACGRSTALESV
jgi:uncharacterized protein (UPF0276 family)